MQVLSLAQAMKLVKLGQISLDGTKIKANAPKHKALSYGHIDKLEAQLREEVQTLLQKAAEADQAEAHDGLDLPGELARREDRLKALSAAKAKIVERVEPRDAEAPRRSKRIRTRSTAVKRNGKRVKSYVDRSPKRRKPARKPVIRLTSLTKNRASC